MGAAEVMVPRVDAVRPIFLTVWSAVALVSEKKKMNKAAHSAKRSFLPQVCEPTQVNTGAAQQPLGRLQRDRRLFLQVVRASRSLDTCWRRLNHVHSFPSLAVDTVWSYKL